MASPPGTPPDIATLQPSPPRGGTSSSHNQNHSSPQEAPTKTDGQQPPPSTPQSPWPPNLVDVIKTIVSKPCNHPAPPPRFLLHNRHRKRQEKLHYPDEEAQRQPPTCTQCQQQLPPRNGIRILENLYHRTTVLAPPNLAKDEADFDPWIALAIGRPTRVTADFRRIQSHRI